MIKLLYQPDSYLREFKTVVIEITDTGVISDPWSNSDRD